MSAADHATFTLRAVQERLGLSRTVLAGLIAAGFVHPARGARNAWRFTFQDLTLLRTAHGLQRSGIPPRTILRSLAKLKAALPAELPLTGLRITAVGADVAVRERTGALAATSGQLLMDFDVAATGAGIAFLDRRAGRPTGIAAEVAAEVPADAPADVPAEGPAGDAGSWLQRAQAFEADGDLAAAQASYRAVLALDPRCSAAYLNLGAMLCEIGEGAAAAALYDAAIEHCPDSAAVWFNRAIALEDRQRLDQAIASYEHSLRLDPALADAHFNLGRLREQGGDPRGALRHYSAYRRLRP